MLTDDALFARLWADYVAIAPHAARIADALTAAGEVVHNDHIALRTVAVPGVDVAALAAPFEARGWQARERYRFVDKHLRAQYWAPPRPGLPRVFISELCLDQVTPEVKAVLEAAVAPEVVALDATASDARLWRGRPWAATHATYQRLLATSEYAAWFYAYGWRVNHFTVDVGALRGHASLNAFCAWLGTQGHALNQAGGTIKGSVAQGLVQASTLAEAAVVGFKDGAFVIPACYFEFAARFPMADGRLFDGFIEGSAARLFESTDVRARG